MARNFLSMGIRAGENWLATIPSPVSLCRFLSGISAGELDFSRDGQWVTYASYPEHTLWRSRADGSDRLQLTYPPVSAGLPRWSPDGTQIVYVDTQPGRPWKIFLISAQGGTPQEVLAEGHTQADRDVVSRWQETRLRSNPGNLDHRSH